MELCAHARRLTLLQPFFRPTGGAAGALVKFFTSLAQLRLRSGCSGAVCARMQTPRGNEVSFYARNFGLQRVSAIARGKKGVDFARRPFAGILRLMGMDNGLGKFGRV